MKILVVGGGGREHALAWKLAQSARVDQVLVAPGNAGTALEPKSRNVAVVAEDIDGLLALARDEAVDLTVVGPEAPLVAGLVDVFSANGMRCFGPSAAAARLEGSKAFAKDFLARHRIPSAAYQTFNDADSARAYIRDQGAPIVVKASGLAAGKGVFVAHTTAEAEQVALDMLSGHSFGPAGQTIVVEEFLRGEEISFIAMVDGEHILPLATSQDHKARDVGDTGPNTGGMGAYSPAMVSDDVHERIMNTVMHPAVRGLRADGSPYTGFLYAGLMIGDDGTPRVLEFNCRFGDPETQPILFRLQSDLLALCEAALDGELAKCVTEWDPRAALGVVMAASGYPESYRKGDPIHGLPDPLTAGDSKIFHAGTSLDNGRVLTAGGRVLCAVALGESVSEAQQQAYALVERISWEDHYYREDIGYRAAAREKGQ